MVGLLDELSAQLEEPFGMAQNDLPLDTITRLIERETLALMGVGTDELPQAMGDDGRFNFL